MKPTKLELLMREQQMLNNWLTVTAFFLGLISGLWIALTFLV